MEWEIEYLSTRHQLEIWADQNLLAKVYLPLSKQWVNGNLLQPKDDFYLVITVIKAGQAVCGCFQNGELIDHKVFRAYMVRKKQGKSQVKYLKTKGKSRAGSRVRLAETERFFEEINSRLAYYDQFPISYWTISCSKTLWPLLFESKQAPPFSKKNEKVYSIPFHVSDSTFDKLEPLYQNLDSIHISIPGDMQIKSLDEILGDEDEADNDDW